PRAGARAWAGPLPWGPPNRARVGLSAGSGGFQPGLARQHPARRAFVDWSSLGALPIGLVFFAGTAFGVLRRRRGHVAARAEYPAIARQLGLTFRTSRYRTGVGTLVGSIEGFKVIVDPDEQRRIMVSFSEAPGVVAYHKADNRRPPPGHAAIRLKNPRVAAFFPTCWATPA